MSKRVLTPAEEVEILICYLGGVPVKKICEAYSIHRMTVHRVITRYGYQTDRKKGVTS